MVTVGRNLAGAAGMAAAVILRHSLHSVAGAEPMEKLLISCPHRTQLGIR
jgi:hypothetical protein